jgi:hypothetical protein
MKEDTKPSHQKAVSELYNTCNVSRHTLDRTCRGLKKRNSRRYLIHDNMQTVVILVEFDLSNHLSVTIVREEQYSTSYDEATPSGIGVPPG